MSKPASPSQVQYLRHLLKQVGGDEPAWATLSDVEASNLIDGIKAKRGRPVFYGNGTFDHWEKNARVAARYMIAAGYFNVGDVVLMGKYKNKRGKIVAFGTDKWGNPTIEIEPIPKGRKQNKIIGLYKIWRADVKENVVKKQQAEEAAAAAGKLASDDWDDHDFDD